MDLIEPLVLLFLIADVVPDHLFIPANLDTKCPRAQKLCPTKFRRFSPYVRARCIALFPLMSPITWETAYLGGIDIILWT
jgi:hypothetical protein